jgi:hypothetical protein
MKGTFRQTWHPGGMTERKPYLTDVSDEDWSPPAPYLTLKNEAAPQRRMNCARCSMHCADSAGGRVMAHAADQFSAVGIGLPTTATVVERTLLRGSGQ